MAWMRPVDALLSAQPGLLDNAAVVGGDLEY